MGAKARVRPPSKSNEFYPALPAFYASNRASAWLQFGFNLERLDPSLVYRALREMEVSGWVASSWDEDSQGPQRRVYKILPDGEGRLADWIADLRRTRDDIDRLLTAYDNQSQKSKEKETQ